MKWIINEITGNEMYQVIVKWYANEIVPTIVEWIGNEIGEKIANEMVLEVSRQ
jgi:hypothetical protein